MRTNPNSKTIAIGIAVIIALLGVFRLMGIGSTRYETSRDEGFRTVDTRNTDSSDNTSSAPEPGSEAIQSPKSSLREATIRVYVCGQVKRPSVMTIPASSTAYDAINRAGGLTSKADAERVNLAASLADGQQLFIPAIGQQMLPSSDGSASRASATSSPTSSRSESTASASGQIININTAGLTELDTLPGVGPVLAQRILDYRSQNGSFNTTDDLLEVKGIGPKKMEQMRPFVSL